MNSMRNYIYKGYFMKFLNRICVITLMSLIAVFSIDIKSEAANTNLIDENSNVSLWQPDDSLVEAQIENENGEIVIKMDGSKLEDYMGYAVVNIGANRLFSVGKNEVLGINYSGLNDNAAYLTIQSNAIDSSQMAYKSTCYILGADDKYYINKGDQGMVKLSRSNGTLLLAGDGFDRTELTSQDMYGIALSLSVVKGKSYEIRISDIVVENNTYRFDDVSIDGKDIIQAPNVGELWFQYKPVNFTPSEFEIINASEDCSIDNDGKLTLTEKTKTANCQIISPYKDNYYVEKDILINEPDSTYYFLNPDNISKVRYPLDFVTDNMVNVIRIVGLIVIAFACVMLVLINMSIRKQEALEEELQ